MSAPEDDVDLERRVLVQRLTFLGGGVVLLGGCKKDEPATPAPAPKRTAPPTTSHLTFTDEEFRILEAACERVLPQDEAPGAKALGVPGYVDRILQTPELSRMKDDFPPGLMALDRRALRAFGKGFPDCSAAQQDEVLTAFKDSAEASGEARWYEMLIVLTLEGALGDPSYGGNKDRAGWALMGFTLVGTAAAEPPPDYDGRKALHVRCGDGKGC